jgi:rubredoxin
MSEHVPLTYESVTAGDRKRRRAYQPHEPWICPMCRSLTHDVYEEYFAGGKWHLGKYIGETCKKCGWGYENPTYEDEPS